MTGRPLQRLAIRGGENVMRADEGEYGRAVDGAGISKPAQGSFFRQSSRRDGFSILITTSSQVGWVRVRRGGWGMVGMQVRHMNLSTKFQLRDSTIVQNFGKAGDGKRKAEGTVAMGGILIDDLGKYRQISIIGLQTGSGLTSNRVRVDGPAVFPHSTTLQNHIKELTEWGEPTLESGHYRKRARRVENYPQNQASSPPTLLENHDPQASQRYGF